MTQTKHTPGPWHCDKTRDVDGSEPRLVFGPSEMGGGVNEVVASTNKGRKTYAADARLIAAAPDLLREAIDLVAFLEQTGLTTEFLNGLRAAIAKAEGQP